MSPAVERRLWIALLLVAALWRFADLGSRAMSHDESLHAYYSWRYTAYGDYRHDPLLHGPLLFHAQALVFALLGDGDTTARLLPALAGVLLVGAPWLFRRELGARGALAAGVLLLLSPSVAFYSRYLRNDVWCALLALVWARALLDYRARGAPRALVTLALAAALDFAAKEVAFLTGAGFGAICLAGAWLERRRPDDGARRWLDLALFQLALALPYLSAVAIRLAGGDPAAFDAAGAPLRAAVWGGAFLAGAAALLAARFRDRGAPRRGALGGLGLFWGILLALYTSLGSNAGRGVASGVAGTLGYWLAQHGVERGEQPLFFYALLAVVYEPVVTALSLAGIVAAARRALRAPRAADAVAEPGGRAVAFFAAWTLLAWLGYSFAGERMPWLLVHIVAPSALVAGAWLDGALPRWRAAISTRAALLAGAAGAAAAVLAADLVVHRPELRLWIPRAAMLAVLAVAAALPLGRAARFATGRSPGAARAAGVAGVVGAGAAAILVAAGLVLTLRTALVAGFVNDQTARETLVYAHGTPELPDIAAELERASRRLAGGFDLEIAYDEETSWPLAWYLRRYPRARSFRGSSGEAELARPAIFVAAEHEGEIAGRLAPTHDRIPFRFVWWPVDSYRGWRAADLTRVFTPGGWRDAAAFWFFRETPGVATEPWPLRRDAALYLARPTLPGP